MPVAPPGDRRPAEPRRSRRARMASRGLPVVAVAVLSLGAGVWAGAAHESDERRAAERFLSAWERQDFGAMYELLDAASRRDTSPAAFERAYQRAADTATVEALDAGEPAERGGGVFEAAVRARTRTFGTLAETVALEIGSTGDDPAGVSWRPELVLPGLRRGEKLSRTVELPPRGTLQARDGQVIAEGPDRTSDLGSLAAEIAGRVGPIPTEEAERYAALGYPPDAFVGLTGLERQFEDRLAGDFGGTLSAGDRVLAEAEPRQAGPVRTSIDPDIEAAAVEALAGRFGGVAVLRPRTGEVLALAGIAFSAPQPPGSVFKIITLAGALDAGVVEPGDEFPVETATTLSGVSLENANGEACGGRLVEAFAESCNSVFAPVGAELGAQRLVEAAERFGFNRPDDIVGAPPGTIPAAEEIGDDLAVGSTAIGQGRLLSTPLRMAEVAAAIANGGELVRPTLLRGGEGRRSRVTSPATAKVVRRAMRLVVREGTGTAAAVPGVAVAGKTGTAELRTTVADPATPPGEEVVDEADTTDTDAWFVAFAPAGRPQVAVAVLLVGAGAGGATAAPVAQVVLDAAVRR